MSRKKKRRNSKDDDPFNINEGSADEDGINIGDSVAQKNMRQSQEFIKEDGGFGENVN